MANPGPYEGAYQDIWTEGSPTPNRIHVAPFPDHFESDGYEISQELPVAINGKIETEGEVIGIAFAPGKASAIASGLTEKHSIPSWTRAFGSSRPKETPTSRPGMWTTRSGQSTTSSAITIA
ncbi:MAG: hypothetical protein R3F31_15645 [Verrucomicrobiales bacterium]